MQPRQVFEYIKGIAGLLLLPVVIGRAIKDQIWFWKNKARVAGKRGEGGELEVLHERLELYREEAPAARERLCREIIEKVFTDTSVPLAQSALKLLLNILDFEYLLAVPVIDLKGSKLSTAEMWEKTGELSRILNSFEKSEVIAGRLERLLRVILLESDLGEREKQAVEDTELSVPLYALLPVPSRSVEGILGEILSERRIDSPFARLWPKLEQNMLIASGIDPTRETSREPTSPTKARMDTVEIIDRYLEGTPFEAVLQTAVPFGVPFSTRFEHTHIVGGSGHGKTQLLQQLILKDLDHVESGERSVIVIDSQGDLLRNIMSLASMGRLDRRLVLIDPNDIDNPPALNLFDFGLDRLTRYNPLEREKLLNGAIALYEYLFGALLGAELTQKQGVIFRYLARLLMTVPGATIHTLMGFMEDTETTRPYLSRLDQTSRHFFETQFFSRAFDSTRQQILTRLWGVLSNTVLERMFANEKNRLDLFDVMNRGGLILINTAKDLLKQDGSEILGRFFISLITQAAQERAAIPESERRSTFVYIDEAQDYFDKSIESLFNQARKYKVGIIVAHQNLDQFDQKIRATVLASTSTKLVGGVSAKDAGIFAKEMNCEPEFLQNMRKGKGHTQFACFVRNHTRAPVALTVPFGQMERGDKLTRSELTRVLSENRVRYSAKGGMRKGPDVPDKEALVPPDLL